ncbi:MAG: DNA translocase FtsK [Bacteroidia bacterium]
MENTTLKSTLERLIRTHLELTDLRIQEADSIKQLGAVLTGKLNDTSNPSKNILKFEDLQIVFKYDSICADIHRNIDIKRDEFKFIAKEVADLFPTFLSLVKTPGGGFSFSFPYEDKVYKIQIKRNRGEGFDNIELILVNDLYHNGIYSRSYSEYAVFDFVDLNFELDNSLTNSEIEVKRIDIDPLIEKAARIVVESQQASVLFIQRKLMIEEEHCDRIIKQLELLGVIAPFTGSQSRSVLIKDFSNLMQRLTELGIKKTENDKK